MGTTSEGKGRGILVLLLCLDGCLLPLFQLGIVQCFLPAIGLEGVPFDNSFFLLKIMLLVLYPVG